MSSNHQTACLHFKSARISSEQYNEVASVPLLILLTGWILEFSCWEPNRAFAEPQQDVPDHLTFGFLPIVSPGSARV